MRKSHYSLRWILAVSMALVFAGSAKSAGAEIKTFIQEYRYRAGQGDDKNAIRIIAMRNVKRLLLEALGTYLEKETATRSDRINKDQLTVLAAGIVETDIIDEKWEGHTYWLKSKMTLDSDEVIRSMDTLRRDREKTREVEELGKQADGLLQESEKRIRELAVAKGKRRETDKMAFEKTIKKLAAIDWSEKGHVQFNRGKYDQAIQDYNQAIELDPQNVGAYYNRGLAHTNLRKHDQAIRDYNRVIELDPAFVTAYVNRGLTSFNFGQHDQAIQDISKAIELNPRLAAAYNVRGIVNANLGKFDQAIRDYDEALGLSPRFVAAYINRGLANFNHARYDQAIQDFNRAIELDPKLTVSHIYRGLAHYTLGKYDQAVQDYNRAIKLNPNQAVPYYNRARVYSRQERHEQALQDLKKAVQINPDFKNTAKTDHDFDRMRKEPEFINLIGE